MISEVEKIDLRKLKLEARYIPRVKKQLDELANTTSQLYFINGSINALEIANNSKIDFVSLFRSIYRDTINAFGESLRKKIKEEQIAEITNEQNERIQEQVDKNSIFYVNNTSETQAQIVTQTNEKEINNAVLFATALFSNKITENRRKIDDLQNEILNINNDIATRNGKVIDLVKRKRNAEKDLNKTITETTQLEKNPKRQISKEINKKIKQDNIARSEFIAEQEVGNTESFIRQKEAEAISKSSILIGAVPIGDEMRKKWDATLDNRTRPAHAAADGQIVNIDESFFVGGEYLFAPRDTNGSFENIARCRCESIFIIF